MFYARKPSGAGLSTSSPSPHIAALPARNESVLQQLREEPARLPAPALQEQAPMSDSLLVGLFPWRMIFFLIVAASVPLLYQVFYVGAMWNPKSHFPEIDVALVTQDRGLNYTRLVEQAGAGGYYRLMMLLPQTLFPTSGLVGLGGVFVGKVITTPALSTYFRWHVNPADATTRQGCIDKVDDRTYWACFYFPPDFSANVVNMVNVRPGVLSDLSLTAPLIPYYAPMFPGVPRNSFELIYDEGRNYGSVSMMQVAWRGIVQQVSSGISASLAILYNTGVVNATGSVTQAAPSNQMTFIKSDFTLNPLAYTEVNLHPVPIYGVNFSSYIFQVVMWIGALIFVLCVSRYMPEHDDARYTQRCPSWAVFGTCARALYALAFTLLCALVVSTVDISFTGGDYIKGYGLAFVWQWYACICYVSMCGVLGAVIGGELFQVPATVILILQLTSCGGIISEEQMFPFFKIGRGFPFYYAVRGIRYIMFGAGGDTMTENGMIIFAWTIVCLPLSIYLVHDNIVRRHRGDRDPPLIRFMKWVKGVKAQTKPVPAAFGETSVVPATTSTSTSGLQIQVTAPSPSYPSSSSSSSSSSASAGTVIPLPHSVEIEMQAVAAKEKEKEPSRKEESKREESKKEESKREESKKEESTNDAERRSSKSADERRESKTAPESSQNKKTTDTIPEETSGGEAQRKNSSSAKQEKEGGSSSEEERRRSRGSSASAKREEESKTAEEGSTKPETIHE